VRPGLIATAHTTVGSQDTQDHDPRRIKRLGLPGFFRRLSCSPSCHTAAYPKPWTADPPYLPDFIMTGAGFPSAGRWHHPLWLNRMLLPAPSARGRFAHPLSGLEFLFPQLRPGGFRRATGVMPLDMPESVLVRFKGKSKPASPCGPPSMPFLTPRCRRIADRQKKGKRTFFRAGYWKLKACRI